MSCKHGEWHQCDLCDEVDAAFKSGYEEGGKLSIDLTMKHLQRAEKAEATNRRMVELMKEPSEGMRDKLFDYYCQNKSRNFEYWQDDLLKFIQTELSAELLKEVGNG